MQAFTHSPLRKAPILALSVLLASVASPADAKRVYIPGGAGELNTGEVRTMSEMRFVDVVPQKMDFSCGSASLATLLTYSYDLPVDERHILTSMYEKGNQEKIQKEGFSLLDMKNYLATLGLHAEGYRAPLDKLKSVGIPAIALINRKGYMHFVVIKGVADNKVLVGDPALGLMTYERAEFEKMWNNILFVILDQKDIASRSFNNPELWAKRNTELDGTFATVNNAADLASMTLIANPSPNHY